MIKKIFFICLFLFVKLLSFSQVVLKQVDIIDYKQNKFDIIYGIDVSRFQGKINWSIIDTSLTFAIIKVSEGISLVIIDFCKIGMGAT